MAELKMPERRGGKSSIYGRRLVDMAEQRVGPNFWQVKDD